MKTQTNNIEEKYNKLIENKNFLNNQNYVLSNEVDKTSKTYGFYFIDGKIVVLNIFNEKDKFIPMLRIFALRILIFILFIIIIMVIMY